MQATTVPASARVLTGIGALMIPWAVTGGRTVAQRSVVTGTTFDSCPQVTAGKFVNAGMSLAALAVALCWPVTVTAGNVVACFSTATGAVELTGGVNATV